MNNIIGPVDFYTINQLRKSIKYMEESNPKEYSKAIDKETKILKYLMENIPTAA
jgi:hypothetical protein